MKNDLMNMSNLQSQVGECYTYFMNNNKITDLEILEDKMLKLQQVMLRLTLTNLVNIVERVVEDGRIDGQTKEKRQFEVSSIQIINDSKITLICHEVIGFDALDKKFILDDMKSYIDFANVTKIY